MSASASIHSVVKKWRWRVGTAVPWGYGRLKRAARAWRAPPQQPFAWQDCRQGTQKPQPAVGRWPAPHLENKKRSRHTAVPIKSHHRGGDVVGGASRQGRLNHGARRGLRQCRAVVGELPRLRVSGVAFGGGWVSGWRRPGSHTPPLRPPSPTAGTHATVTHAAATTRPPAPPPARQAASLPSPRARPPTLLSASSARSRASSSGSASVTPSVATSSSASRGVRQHDATDGSGEMRACGCLNK